MKKPRMILGRADANRTAIYQTRLQAVLTELRLKGENDPYRTPAEIRQLIGCSSAAFTKNYLDGKFPTSQVRNLEVRKALVKAYSLNFLFLHPELMEKRKAYPGKVVTSLLDAGRNSPPASAIDGPVKMLNR